MKGKVEVEGDLGTDGDFVFEGAEAGGRRQEVGGKK